MDTIKFGAFLKELRKEHGLTQGQLADKLGTTNRTVSRWETGSNVPDIDFLIELSEFYQIDIKDLLSGKRKGVESRNGSREFHIVQVTVAESIRVMHCLNNIHISKGSEVRELPSLLLLYIIF